MACAERSANMDVAHSLPLCTCFDLFHYLVKFIIHLSSLESGLLISGIIILILIIPTRYMALLELLHKVEAQ